MEICRKALNFTLLINTISMYLYRDVYVEAFKASQSRVKVPKVASKPTIHSLLRAKLVSLVQQITELLQALQCRRNC